MPHPLSSWLDAQPPQRRRLYSVLVAVILLTVPCYAAGIALLVLAPPSADGSPPAATLDAGAVPEQLPVPTATPVIREILWPPSTAVISVASATALPPTNTEQPTSTPEFVVVTVPPTVPPTAAWSSPWPPTEPPTAVATIGATEMPNEDTPPPPDTAVPTSEPSEPVPPSQTPES